MTRVEINAGGRVIVVDHTGELEPIRAAALALWHATDTGQPPAGPAVGFMADRRGTDEVRPTAHSSYGRRPMAPVTAAQRQETPW